MLLSCLSVKAKLTHKKCPKVYGQRVLVTPCVFVCFASSSVPCALSCSLLARRLSQDNNKLKCGDPGRSGFPPEATDWKVNYCDSWERVSRACSPAPGLSPLHQKETLSFLFFMSRLDLSRLDVGGPFMKCQRVVKR